MLNIYTGIKVKITLVHIIFMPQDMLSLYEKDTLNLAHLTKKKKRFSYFVLRNFIIDKFWLK